ncbi:MAG: hypothetical protein WB785_03275 [Mycobacterium sp.]
MLRHYFMHATQINGKPMPSGRRWPRMLARATTATLAVLALTQAVFAGSFLGGQYNALMLHSLGAKASTVLSVVQVIVLWFVSRSGGPRSLVAVAALVTVLLVAEFASGELRLTALHVPLGVLLITGILQLTASVWRLPLTTPAREQPLDVTW